MVSERKPIQGLQPPRVKGNRTGSGMGGPSFSTSTSTSTHPRSATPQPRACSPALIDQVLVESTGVSSMGSWGGPGMFARSFSRTGSSPSPSRKGSIGRKQSMRTKSSLSIPSLISGVSSVMDPPSSCGGSYNPNRCDLSAWSTSIRPLNILENVMDVPTSRKPPTAPTTLESGPKGKSVKTATAADIWKNSVCELPAGSVEMAAQRSVSLPEKAEVTEKDLRLDPPRVFAGQVQPQEFQVSTEFKSLPDEKSVVGAVKTPAQRRTELEEVVRQRQAARALREAKIAKQRIDLKLRTEHPAGFLGGESTALDPCALPEDSVYATEAERLMKLQREQTERAAVRQEWLISNQRKKGSGGSKMLHYMEDAEEIKSDQRDDAGWCGGFRIFPKKRGPPSPPKTSFQDDNSPFNYVSNSSPTVSPTPQTRRGERLKYCAHRNRDFDFLSGVKLPQHPCPYSDE